MTTLTLPILAALAHLHAHNLTIDRLYTTQPDTGPPQTHATTKPRPPQPDHAPSATPIPSGPPTCTICHRPKDNSDHATCLSVPCLEIFFGRR